MYLGKVIPLNSDLSLDVATLGKGNKPGIHDLCFPVDSFDLRCESVTYCYTHAIVVNFLCLAIRFIRTGCRVHDMSRGTSHLVEFHALFLLHISWYSISHDTPCLMKIKNSMENI